MKLKLVFAAAILTGAHWIGHIVTLENLPGLIMDRAHRQLVRAFGVQENTWTMAPAITPTMRAVVRPSPDLAYSICLLNLSDGPVTIEVPPGNTYGSLSIFQRNTDNVFNAPLEGIDEMTRVIVWKAGKPRPETGPGTAEVALNSTFGIALVRRLAPNEAAFDVAAVKHSQSKCHPT